MDMLRSCHNSTRCGKPIWLCARKDELFRTAHWQKRACLPWRRISLPLEEAPCALLLRRCRRARGGSLRWRSVWRFLPGCELLIPASACEGASDALDAAHAAEALNKISQGAPCCCHQPCRWSGVPCMHVSLGLLSYLRNHSSLTKWYGS